jgi:GH15 family glucan-1,4-alpha-glucosidase
MHTYSVAMSWAGCDRLARIARWLGLDERVGYWEQQAQALRSTILERAWNPQVRAFTSAFGGAELDATVMLLPELGLLPATDPRFVATVDAIERLLKDGDWMFRYRHPDDFGRPRTAFTVCGWLNARNLNEGFGGNRIDVHADTAALLQELIAARAR